MITGKGRIKNRPRKIQRSVRRTKGEIKTRRGVGTGVNTSIRTSVQENQITGSQKLFQEATTGRDNRVTPQGMTAIKITQKKEGVRQPGEERVKLGKINRNRRGKIEKLR